MDDETALSQLVLRERQGRDRGRWLQMASAYVPGARIRLSWIDGTAEQFVAGSRVMAERGTTAAHRMGPPLVSLVADRAIVEAAAVIELRTMLGDVEVDLASRVRLVYRAERFERTWLLTSLDCIYETDSIVPVIPGRVPTIDDERMTRLRPSYRWLSYILGATGHPIADDLPGEDDPDSVARLYSFLTAWLEQRSAA